MFNTESIQVKTHEVLNKAATEEQETIIRLRKKAERQEFYIAAVANQTRVAVPAL